MFSNIAQAFQEPIVLLKNKIKTAEKVVLGHITKREPLTQTTDDNLDKVCGWKLHVEVIHSFKGGKDSFEVYTNDELTYIGETATYFVIAFANPSYGSGKSSEVGNCAKQPDDEYLVQDPNGSEGDMIAMVRLGPHEKKFSELNISNIKYSSIMGSISSPQYIFALDDYSKEKYGGDWLIQPAEYKLDDTVYTKFIDAGENEKYPDFYTALNFFDLLKQTLYSKD